MNIAIKLPNDLKGKILSFPFIHALVKEVKKILDEQEDEVLNLHLISNKTDIDVLNLLPFSAYYHEIEDEDLKTVFSAHRACVTLKIDHVDYFISTTESFVDASLGKNLSAKNKVGFAIGKNKFFLNKKINMPSNENQSEKIFSLISALDIEEIPNIRSVCSREVKPLYADWNMNPYFVINLSLKDKEIHPEWKELIDLFEHQNLILMCDEFELNDQKEELEDFIKTLSTKNTYKIFETGSNIDFAKMVTYAWAFISEDSPFIQLAAYCGAEIFHLNRKEDQKKYGTKYLVGDVNLYSLQDPAFKDGSDFQYAKIFDEIYKYIDLKSKDHQ